MGNVRTPKLMRREIPEIPSCFKDLPGETLLDMDTVSRIFRYKSRDSINNAITRGFIPKCDLYYARGKFSNSGRPRPYWYLSTIRKTIKELYDD